MTKFYHFNFNVVDLERSLAFYKQALNLSPLREKQAEDQRMAAEKEAADKRTADLRAFAAQYPGVKQFPPEVLEAIQGGRTPLEAYQTYELAQVKAELEAVKKNQENKAKAVGSVRDGAAPQKKDSFLEGFDMG